MNFGNVGFIEVLFVLIVWALPVALVVWFIVAISRISRSVRDISIRLASLEIALREGAMRRT